MSMHGMFSLECHILLLLLLDLIVAFEQKSDNTNSKRKRAAVNCFMSVIYALNTHLCVYMSIVRVVTPRQSIKTISVA